MGDSSEWMLCPETLAESKLPWVLEQTVRSIVYNVFSSWRGPSFGLGLRLFRVFREMRSNRQSGKGCRTFVDRQGILNTVKCFLLFISSPFLWLSALSCFLQRECKQLGKKKKYESWFSHASVSPRKEPRVASPALCFYFQDSLWCISLISPVSSTASTLEGPPRSSLWTQRGNTTSKNDWRTHKGDPGNPKVFQASDNGEEPQQRSGGHHGPLGQWDSVDGCYGGCGALLLPLHRPLCCGGPHRWDSGHCSGLQLQFPWLHHLHLGSGPSVIWTFFVSFQCLVLEGEAEEQESQETGESDGSCGKSEKLICLGLNGTKWDMWPENLLFTVSSSSPRTSMWENKQSIGIDRRNWGELRLRG